MSAFTASVVGEAALAWLESLGYAVLHGPDIAVGMLGAKRSDLNYREVTWERNRAVDQYPRQTQLTFGGHE